MVIATLPVAFTAFPTAACNAAMAMVGARARSACSSAEVVYVQTPAHVKRRTTGDGLYNVGAIQAERKLKSRKQESEIDNLQENLA